MVQADLINSTEACDNHLEDKERAEDAAAFEHACKIKGAPFETTLLLEYPELGGKIYSVAPGEGQKPIPILTDPKFEEMCNPNKYPLGRRGIIPQRPKQITPRKYFQSADP